MTVRDVLICTKALLHYTEGIGIKLVKDEKKGLYKPILGLLS